MCSDTRISQSGFSLVELAVVLVVVAALLATILLGAASVLQRARISDTEKHLNLAVQAISGFLYTTGRLPCPDTNGDGVEAVADCDAAAGDPLVGALPARTLGVGGVDPWGGAYVYAVDTDFADTSPGGDVTFSLSEPSEANIDLEIEDGTGTTIAENVALVVFSRGPNRYTGQAGAGRPSENENNDNDGIFRRATYSDSGNNIYDDVIEWVSANVLKAKMVEAGKLP